MTGHAASRACRATAGRADREADEQAQRERGRLHERIHVERLVERDAVGGRSHSQNARSDTYLASDRGIEPLVAVHTPQYIGAGIEHGLLVVLFGGLDDARFRRSAALVPFVVAARARREHQRVATRGSRWRCLDVSHSSSVCAIFEGAFMVMTVPTDADCVTVGSTTFVSIMTLSTYRTAHCGRCRFGSTNTD
jgi:hypothetical protein